MPRPLRFICCLILFIAGYFNIFFKKNKTELVAAMLLAYHLSRPRRQRVRACVDGTGCASSLPPRKAAAGAGAGAAGTEALRRAAACDPFALWLWVNKAVTDARSCPSSLVFLLLLIRLSFSR